MILELRGQLLERGGLDELVALLYPQLGFSRAIRGGGRCWPMRVWPGQGVAGLAPSSLPVAHPGLCR